MYYVDRDNKAREWCVECVKCKCQIHALTQDELAEKWNKRSFEVKP
jgi:hypothetical protein